MKQKSKKPKVKKFLLCQLSVCVKLELIHILMETNKEALSFPILFGLIFLQTDMEGKDYFQINS